MFVQAHDQVHPAERAGRQLGGGGGAGVGGGGRGDARHGALGLLRPLQRRARPCAPPGHRCGYTRDILQGK